MEHLMTLLIVAMIITVIAVSIQQSRMKGVSFSNKDKEQYVVDSRCTDVDTTKLLKVYQLNINELSKDIVDTGIDVSLVEDPKSYPIIASQLLAAGKITCDKATGVLERP